MSHSIDPDTGHLLVDGQRVYAQLVGGRLHCMVRATDRDTFQQQALLVGLLVYSDPGQSAVIDPETGEVITPATPPSGDLIPAPEVTICEIGNLVLVPGQYDEDGNEIVAPVVDSRWHVNFWLDAGLTAEDGWEQWALTWTQNGAPVAPNAHEEAIAYQGIELIDPTTIATPANVLL